MKWLFESNEVHDAVISLHLESLSQNGTLYPLPKTAETKSDISQA